MQIPGKVERKRWRFGLRSLLVATLVAGSLLAAWRYRATGELRAIAAAIEDTSFDATRLVHHRGFRSSGLCERIASASNGFGAIQVRVIDAASYQQAESTVECWILEDLSRRGNRESFLVVAMAQRGSALSWIELSSNADRRISPPKLITTGPVTHCESIAWSTRPPVVRWIEQYQLDPSGIERLSSEVSHDHAENEAEFIRSLGIGRHSQKVNELSVPGPESDLE